MASWFKGKHIKKSLFYASDIHPQIHNPNYILSLDSSRTTGCKNVLEITI